MVRRATKNTGEWELDLGLVTRKAWEKAMQSPCKAHCDIRVRKIMALYTEKKTCVNRLFRGVEKPLYTITCTVLDGLGMCRGREI